MSRKILCTCIKTFKIRQKVFNIRQTAVLKQKLTKIIWDNSEILIIFAAEKDLWLRFMVD